VKGVREDYSCLSLDTGLDVLDIHAPVEDEFSVDISKPHSEPSIFPRSPGRLLSRPNHPGKFVNKPKNPGQKLVPLRTRELPVPLPVQIEHKSAKAAGTSISSEIPSSSRNSRSQTVYSSSSSESYRKPNIRQ
jgi:hypothetical protein